ncbi:hypothetical protein [Brachybacterium phenoliresistens]|uniref:hypothetical protein n=1 Tax=Brachybacterium phenoliresistens TaxID=396014 RepID=UPI0031DD93A6
MTTKTIQQQVQAGIDARVDQDPAVRMGRGYSVAYATMLGHDGSTVEQAVEAAWKPGGPSRDEIRRHIEWRRADPASFPPDSLCSVTPRPSRRAAASASHGRVAA